MKPILFWALYIFGSGPENEVQPGEWATPEACSSAAMALGVSDVRMVERYNFRAFYLANRATKEKVAVCLPHTFRVEQR